MVVTANDPDGSSAISIHLKTVRLFLFALILFLHGAVGDDVYKEITHYRSVSDLPPVTVFLMMWGDYQRKKVGVLTGNTQRPDLSAPPMTLELKRKEKLTTGYIFLTPYEIKNPGPYIFDTDGVRIDHQVSFISFPNVRL